MGKETYKLKQHQRCVDILDLAIRAKNAIETQNVRLRRFDNSTWDKPIRLFYTRESIEKEKLKYELVYERITKWYNDNFDKLTSIN